MKTSDPSPPAAPERLRSLGEEAFAALKERRALALAPMQDVTDLPFMQVTSRRGAPDLYYTEFLRVHSQSRPEKHILQAIDQHGTGKPVFAQMIGEDVFHLERTVADLLKHPVAAIDLNLGCPAPKVYKKNVGGGLLRDPARVDEILGALRATVPGLFTVKMRIGFEDTRHFDTLLDLINTHRVDLLVVHGRTVREMYRSEVHYDAIAHAASRVRCPVLANGNVTSAAKAREVISQTGAAGVMIGRHAIRNPWIFAQCRDLLAGREPKAATLAEVREYIHDLFVSTRSEGIPEIAHVNKMKKYLNFVGQSVDPEGRFLHDMRRTRTAAELFAVCDEHLMREPGKPFPLEPFAGVIARPNCETPDADACSLDTVTG
ncbi:MAG: tRNA-dihydrouridine synthase family protein [Opitutaceae bacterium]|nr:tRNA-dihydrouridine synthase family protein [Opitutaceae bacterium]